MFFFSQADDISQFKRLDSFISKALIKNGLKEEIIRVKKFTRAYHEIRFSLNETKYVPKFDTVSVSEMIATLSVFEGISTEEVASRYKFRAADSIRGDDGPAGNFGIGESGAL